LRALADADFPAALACLASEGRVWDGAELGEALIPFFAERSRLRLDPEARNARHTYIQPGDSADQWRVQQMLLDPEECNDWVAEFLVDLPASRAAGTARVSLLRLGPLVEFRKAD
jgi:hypothetical protein